MHEHARRPLNQGFHNERSDLVSTCLELAMKRAAAVKTMIAEFGFRGQVYIDEEAPELPVADAGDETLQRSAILRVGG